MSGKSLKYETPVPAKGGQTGYLRGEIRFPIVPFRGLLERLIQGNESVMMKIEMKPIPLDQTTESLVLCTIHSIQLEEEG